MAIYTRGDATPFILKARSDEAGTSLFGYWIDMPGEVQPCEWIETDRSRIVADGGANEIEPIIAELPIVNTKTRRVRPAPRKARS